jgi:gamma-glutamyltranspeptidase/glutathione hydrolase
MVATSHPLATWAGLRAIDRGGNAVDAALAAAAMMCIGEPLSTGVGGDAFALIWKNGVLRGLDAAGAAPRSAHPLVPVEQSGPRSVTAPGAVAGWDALAREYGRFGLDVALTDAIDSAERGIAATAATCEIWEKAGGPTEAGGAVPGVGDRYRLPLLAASLRAIAEKGPSAFYRGPIADAICTACWLELDDLESVAVRWVDPLRTDYRGVTVYEMPPPTQGIAVLEALSLLNLDRPTLADQVECVRLALEDAFAHVRDEAQVAWLLASDYLAQHRTRRVASSTEPHGGTVYLCAVASDGMAVSFIQSLYEGKGPEVPDTGIILQNRGAGFAVSGAVEPGRRPYHTIIPGMLARDEQLLGPFGVMGGFMQAQGHVQLVSALVDDELDPQGALDRARFRIDGSKIHLEEGLWPCADELKHLGETVLSTETLTFGAGNAILVEGNVLVGGSDSRKDGYAAGF